MVRVVNAFLRLVPVLAASCGAVGSTARDRATLVRSEAIGTTSSVDGKAGASGNEAGGKPVWMTKNTTVEGPTYLKSTRSQDVKRDSKRTAGQAVPMADSSIAKTAGTSGKEVGGKPVWLTRNTTVEGPKYLKWVRSQDTVSPSAARSKDILAKAKHGQRTEFEVFRGPNTCSTRLMRFTSREVLDITRGKCSRGWIEYDPAAKMQFKSSRASIKLCRQADDSVKISIFYLRLCFPSEALFEAIVSSDQMEGILGSYCISTENAQKHNVAMYNWKPSTGNASRIKTCR